MQNLTASQFRRGVTKFVSSYTDCYEHGIPYQKPHTESFDYLVKAAVVENDIYTH